MSGSILYHNEVGLEGLSKRVTTHKQKTNHHKPPQRQSGFAITMPHTDMHSDSSSSDDENLVITPASSKRIRLQKMKQSSGVANGGRTHTRTASASHKVGNDATVINRPTVFVFHRIEPESACNNTHTNSETNSPPPVYLPPAKMGRKPHLYI